MSKTFKLFGSLLAAANLVGTAVADTVKMTGATTVLNVVISPAKPAVEKSTGHTLAIIGSGTGKGLADLVEGASDIAMVSEPMEIAIEAAAAAGKKVDPKTIQFFELKKDEIVFVVHPSNPVGKLTWEQIRDIHTGKITNWKGVGGKDLPIVVYSDAITGGTRAMVKKIVMGGVEYGSTVKAQTSVKRAAEMVGADEAGITGVGKGFVDLSKNKTLDTKKLERPLALATMGAPKPPAKAVIDAFIKEAKSQ
ncbi:substrate-binding domain-containing protein [Paucibacter sp. DJ2R-2]|uniref:substrate-binding domain-containing protein n=1 Tax=Paucibacter sp. DJ2R-2 TaxID=2893558 RepID=UPI0021E4F57D|nr:substrate-binding domain-containing protein [Paucibacter sp. DJ2R-2]MCV2438655.1 substrate-binding domain-containing protein [Paucibacter sp. DJ2R-2]